MACTRGRRGGDYSRANDAAATDAPAMLTCAAGTLPRRTPHGQTLYHAVFRRVVDRVRQPELDQLPFINMLQLLGVEADHTAIRTSSYSGIGRRAEAVHIDGLDYVTARLQPGAALLLVDDVHDTGLSLQQVVTELRACSVGHTVDIRLATPWYKPGNNRRDAPPDYFLHQSDDWLVFPHELNGLNRDEVLTNKPGMKAIFEEYGI